MLSDRKSGLASAHSELYGTAYDGVYFALVAGFVLVLVYVLNLLKKPGRYHII